MRFTPKTQAELDAENLLEKGEYPFTVVSAVEKKDKNGNDFFAIKLTLHGEYDWTAFDNLSNAWMAHKLKHFCECTGVSYESGNLTCEQLAGLTGHCDVDIEPAKGGFKAKNVVKDYIVAESQKAPKPAAKPAADNDDDSVPF